MSEVVQLPGAAPVPLIAIGVPSFDTVMTDFAFAMSAMTMMTRGRIGLISGRSSIVCSARNNIVEAAQKMGAEWLLMVDSDMIFPSNTLERLLAHKKDIVGAVYRRRVGEFELLGTPAVGDQLIVNGALAEMAIIPTGCILIRMSVFDKFAKPYFRFEFDEVKGRTIGEDVLFCRMARERGFTVWCDVALSNEVGHVGIQTVWTNAEAAQAQYMQKFVGTQ